VSPLCEPGREEQLAEAFATRLGSALGGGAAFVQLEWLDGLSPWPELLRRHWPRRVAFRRDANLVTPLVRLDPEGDDERFLAGYSKNFRKSLRRAHREMTLRGGAVRRADDPARLAADVRALFALHRLRFAAKGEKSSIDAGHEQAVLAAAPRLLADGHLRLWIVEDAGTVVAADLHLWAGERMFAWNGGIDPAWEHESLGLILLDAAVRDAHTLGVSVLDLGPGETDFKRRIAKTSATVVSRSLWPVGAGLPVARARLGPKHARVQAGRVAARLPSEQRARIKRVLGDRV
jgi:CelD/BcsL family acetyltransferase involved in cellulose biosynthesis